MMIEEIIDAVNASADRYYRLVVLIDKTRDHAELSQKIEDQFNTEVVNVNFELSKHLLNQTVRQRKLYLSKLMNKIVPNNKVVILDHIEILFDVDLELDPLRFLESLSRNQTVIVFWNGQIKDGKLFYAAQGHSEFRSYDAGDALVREINTEKVRI